MGWREYAAEVQGVRDNRDIRDKSPPETPNVSIVPNVPVVVAEREAQGWLTALRQVDPRQPPEGFCGARWYRLYDCSVWLLEHYGRAAARGGWSAGDLFGLRDAMEGKGGLADRLGNCRVLVLDGPRARWRSFGATFALNAGAGANLLPWWSIKG